MRGERVMLDRDLAFLYETETKSLNLAVKRNLKILSKQASSSGYAALNCLLVNLFIIQNLESSER